MILWILAIILMGCLGLIGYYQGAIRVAFSFVGLLVAAVLALPLAPAIKPLLRLVGVDHPVTLAFVAPFLVYLVILAAFKSGGFALHKKLDTYYKYKVSDTERMLWERVNSRLGICLGLANAFVYLLLISTVAYVVGYFTVQVSTAENASFTVKMANLLADDLQSTKMGKVVSGFVPGSEIYYDAIDVMGDLYKNPLMESRLASYPPFMKLAEEGQFKELGKDKDFQEKLWLKQPRPSLGALIGHEKMQPLVGNVDVFTNIMGMLNWDLKDLKTYIETGKTPKYEEEHLLGHWYYDYATSFRRARKAKPIVTPVEGKKLRESLGAFTNGVLTAFVEKKVTLRVPATNNSPPLVLSGEWENAGTDKYDFTLHSAGKTLDVPASIEGAKLVLKKENLQLYFER